MDLPAIYLIILLSYLMLLFAFMIRNWVLMILTCFLMFVLSIYTFTNGIGAFAYDNFVVIMFSAVTFGLAAYISLKTTLELINENY